MSCFKVSLALASMVVLVSSAWAQNGAATASTTAIDGSGAHVARDARFVTAASAAGLTEILASKLAETQGQSAKVKAFAATMIGDHTKVDAELKGVAQKSGYTVSATPTQAQEAHLAKLRGLRGKDFDMAYARMMVKDHRKAVGLFQGESTSGTDGELKTFATQTLPVLQHHLALANAL